MSNRIAEVRQARGLSQAELAKLMGTSQQQVDRYEKPGANVKADALVAASKALGVSVTYLLGMENEPWIRTQRALSPDERALVDFYNSMDADKRAILLSTARAFAGDAEVEGAEGRAV